MGSLIQLIGSMRIPVARLRKNTLLGSFQLVGERLHPSSEFYRVVVFLVCLVVGSNLNVAVVLVVIPETGDNGDRGVVCGYSIL